MEFHNVYHFETADYAMRNARYKLLRSDGEEEFYDLQNDLMDTKIS